MPRPAAVTRACADLCHAPTSSTYLHAALASLPSTTPRRGGGKLLAEDAGAADLPRAALFDVTNAVAEDEALVRALRCRQRAALFLAGSFYSCRAQS